MKHVTPWAWVNLAGLVLVLAVNGLANALPLNGITTAAVSALVRVYFVPAGYVFAIWGLIYLLLLTMVIWGLTPGARPTVVRGGPWFAVSCLANASWLFAWHYQRFPLTMALMAVLLASLIALYLRLGVGRPGASRAARWLARLPISIYLGWISVATIANATTALAHAGWGGWGLSPTLWADILLGVATLLAAAMAWLRRDLAFGLVVVWAQVGIALAQATTPAVAGPAWAAAGLTAILTLVLAGLRRRASPARS